MESSTPHRNHHRKFAVESLTYHARAELLAAHGWPSYEAYLQSTLWATIGRRAKAGRLCGCGCGRPATQVHHAAYTEANLLGRSSEGLVPIHHLCHRAIEYTPEGNKRSLPDANGELAARRAAHGKGDRAARGVPGVAGSSPRPLYRKR